MSILCDRCFHFFGHRLVGAILCILAFASHNQGHCQQGQDTDVTKEGRLEVTHITSLDDSRVFWQRDIVGNGYDILLGDDQVVVFANSTMPHIHSYWEDSDGAVVAGFGIDDGGLLWRQYFQRSDYWPQDLPLTSIRTYSDLSDGRLVFISNHNEIVCLDLTKTPSEADEIINTEVFADEWTPYLAWRLDLDQDYKVNRREHTRLAARVGGVRLVNGVYYVVTGHGSAMNPESEEPGTVFMAIARDSAEVTWKFDSSEMGRISGHFSVPTPIHMNGDTLILFPGGDNVLYALDPIDNQIVWTFDCVEGIVEGGDRSALLLLSPLVVGNDMVVVALSTDLEKTHQNRSVLLGLHMQDDAPPTVRWKWQPEYFGGTYAPVHLHNSMLYVMGYSDRLFAIDLQSGNKVWTFDWDYGPRIAQHAGAVVIDEKLLIPADEGLYVIPVDDPRGLKRLIDFGGKPIMATPKANDERLFVVAGQWLFSICRSVIHEP